MGRCDRRVLSRSGHAERQRKRTMTNGTDSAGPGRNRRQGRPPAYSPADPRRTGALWLSRPSVIPSVNSSSRSRGSRYSSAISNCAASGASGSRRPRSRGATALPWHSSSGAGCPALRSAGKELVSNGEDRCRTPHARLRRRWRRRAGACSTPRRRVSACRTASHIPPTAG